MCGICGIYNFGEPRPVSRTMLQSMNRTMVHRGPDDEGEFVENNIGIAMRRLSIIDLASGRQPIHNEDKSKWIVFNGEIFNYRELKELF
jgi:asparagine synthase (glutamine-hydrolysing)